MTKGTAMFSVAEILNLAGQIEHNAERVYRNALQQDCNPAISSVLQWLADEEDKHARWLDTLNQSLPLCRNNPIAEEVGKEFLRDILGDQSFSLNEADFCGMEQLDDLLLLAIEFEKDKEVFYTFLTQFIDDPKTKNIIDTLLQEANRHLQSLQAVLAQGSEAFALHTGSTSG
jgi:rubrerythrin